jgi:hypothetical protein
MLVSARRRSRAGIGPRVFGKVTDGSDARRKFVHVGHEGLGFLRADHHAGALAAHGELRLWRKGEAPPARDANFFGKEHRVELEHRGVGVGDSAVDSVLRCLLRDIDDDARLRRVVGEPRVVADFDVVARAVRRPRRSEAMQ